MKKKQSRAKLQSDKPISFSDHFNADKKNLEKLGVFNPILNLDTKLFVEPLLLKDSKSEIIKNSFDDYKQYFANILLLIRKSKVYDSSDIHWRTAKKLVRFPEYKSTCIGYGRETTSGSGSSRSLDEKILFNARDIIDSAQDNPEIFLLLPFLEDGIGGDIISDMTQKIIDDKICEYTVDILTKLGIEGDHLYEAESGNVYNLPFNHYANCPLKLLPRDILLDLPIADNFDNWIVDISAHNHNLRKKINKFIGSVWIEKNKSDKKEDVLNKLRTDKGFFLEILKILRDESFEHYNLEEDYHGLYRWFEDGKKLSKTKGLEISEIKKNSQKSLDSAIGEIIANFKSLIENKDVWRMFWTERKSKFYHVNELYSQMLFFSICESWLNSQNSNIKISRNIDKVDKQLKFVFSLGNKFQTIVQIKHSNNASLHKMYGKQIKSCERIGIGGLYLVMNFKEDRSEQFKSIKEGENELCKITEIDVAIQSNESQGELDFIGDLNGWDLDLGDTCIEFDEIPEIEDIYTEEKRKGGETSGRKYKPLRDKVKEICKAELKKGGFNASTLCESVSYIIENDHPELLENFEPYQVHSENGGGWTKGSFYNWCNDFYKTYK